MNSHLLKLGLALALTLALVAASAPAGAKQGRSKTCPKKRSNIQIFSIGSSTMGSTLGPMLKDLLKKRKVVAKYWGKASSGLARSDFHDWIGKVPKIIKKHRPDIFIVSLGTNDGQHLYDKGKWIRYQDPKWSKAYGKRVTQLLKLMGGRRGMRPILWLGPTALPHERAAKRMKRVRTIIRNRVRKFGKSARFIDGIALTTDKKGELIQRVQPPRAKRSYAARAKDNIHLTTRGVRWLLAEPLLKRLRRCL